VEYTDLLARVVITSPGVAARLSEHTAGALPSARALNAVGARAIVEIRRRQTSAHPVRDIIKLAQGTAAEAI
jgi:hypothetical protein